MLFCARRQHVPFVICSILNAMVPADGNVSVDVPQVNSATDKPTQACSDIEATIVTDAIHALHTAGHTIHGYSLGGQARCADAKDFAITPLGMTASFSLCSLPQVQTQCCAACQAEADAKSANEAAGSVKILTFSSEDYIESSHKFCDMMLALSYTPTIVALDDATYAAFEDSGCHRERGTGKCDWKRDEDAKLWKLWSCRLDTLLKEVSRDQSVFLTDNDIFWRRNVPLESFVKYDVYHGMGTTWPDNVYDEQGWVVNAGMGLWRATSFTKDLLQHLVDACDNYCDDQTVLNNLYLDMGSKNWRNSDDQWFSHTSDHVAVWNRDLVQRDQAMHCDAWIDAPLSDKTGEAKLDKWALSERECGATSKATRQSH